MNWVATLCECSMFKMLGLDVASSKDRVMMHTRYRHNGWGRRQVWQYCHKRRQ